MCPPFWKARAIFGCAWSLVSLIHLKTDRNLLSDRVPRGSQMCYTCREEHLCLSVSTWATGILFLDFLIPGGRIPEVEGAISAGRVPQGSRRVSWWKHICQRKRAWIWFLASSLHYSHDHHCPGWCSSNCKWGRTSALEACWQETKSSFTQKVFHHSAPPKTNPVNTMFLPPQPLIKQLNRRS